MAGLLAAGLTVAPTMATAESPRPENLAEARKAYEEGNTHYSLGEYDAAVAAFRRAYGLAPAPALLFDVAQAYRLSGNCERAFEAYRHFVRLDPTSDHRADADRNLAMLQARCGGPSPSTVPGSKPQSTTRASVTIPAAIVTPLVERPSSPRSVVATRVFLIGGVAVGVAAAVTYFWNDTRFSTWTHEDRTLAGTRPSNVDPDTWVERQNENDRRLRSIQTVDGVFGTLAGVSAAALAAAAVVAYLPARGTPAVALRPDGCMLAWSARWP